MKWLYQEVNIDQGRLPSCHIRFAIVAFAGSRLINADFRQSGLGDTAVLMLCAGALKRMKIHGRCSSCLTKDSAVHVNSGQRYWHALRLHPPATNRTINSERGGLRNWLSRVIWAWLKNILWQLKSGARQREIRFPEHGTYLLGDILRNILRHRLQRILITKRFWTWHKPWLSLYLTVKCSFGQTVETTGPANPFSITAPYIHTDN